MGRIEGCPLNYAIQHKADVSLKENDSIMGLMFSLVSVLAGGAWPVHVIALYVDIYPAHSGRLTQLGCPS